MKKSNYVFDELKTHTQNYVEDMLALVKLKAVEKSSKLFASLFTALLITVVCFFILIFLSIMAGDWFAVLLGSQYKGFLVIGGFYVLVLLFLLTVGRKITSRFISNIIIEIFFNKTNEDNEKSGK